MAVLTTPQTLAEHFQKSSTRSRRRLHAFGSALGLEALVIGVVIAWTINAQPKVPGQVITLALESVAAPAIPLPPEQLKPDKVKPESPQAKPETKRVVQASVPAAALPIPSSSPSPSPVSEAAPATAPLASTTAPIAAAVATPAAVPAVPATDLSPAFNAKIAAAVQAAFQIPAAASTLGFKGRARVEFSLLEGTARSIRIVLSSGFGTVDRAAVQAVQSAVYPAPPAALAGSEGTYQIWVACF